MADKEQSAFERLAALDVGRYIEKKGNLSYLSWAWAVDQLLRADPRASWVYGEPMRFGETMMVVCTVGAFGQERTMQLPVMDHRNKAIPNPDAFAVNTAMQRCLVKAIALHGLGLYIYAGEDVPRGTDPAPGDGAAEPTEAQLIALQELRDAALNGTDALKVAWQAAGADTRRALADELPALKAAAAEADRA
jgi:hypothetical protein